MNHSEQLELETLQPRNSFVLADGRARRGVRPPRPCARLRRPLPPALHSPAAGGEGSLFFGVKRNRGQSLPLVVVRASSWSLAQVSPAAASVLTEEVWKEGAGRKRLESVTPPPSYDAVYKAQ